MYRANRFRLISVASQALETCMGDDETDIRMFANQYLIADSQSSEVEEFFDCVEKLEALDATQLELAIQRLAVLGEL